MNSTFIHVYIYCAFLLPFRSCIYKVFCVNNIMYMYSISKKYLFFVW